MGIAASSQPAAAFVVNQSFAGAVCSTDGSETSRSCQLPRQDSILLGSLAELPPFRLIDKWSASYMNQPDRWMDT